MTPNMEEMKSGAARHCIFLEVCRAALSPYPESSSRAQRGISTRPLAFGGAKFNSGLGDASPLGAGYYILMNFPLAKVLPFSNFIK